MSCVERRAELVAYVDGQLAPAERAELETHLAGCATCQSALAAERGLSGMLGALPAVRPSPDFEARFWARIAREQDARPGWLARLFTRRLALGLGGAAVAALAVVLALRGRTDPEADADWPIVANAEDYELLEDPDLRLIEVLETLEAEPGDQG